MKKVLIISVVLMLILPTIAFADTDVYQVIVDGTLQGYVGEDLEDGIYIPYVGLLTTLGEKNMPVVDESLLNMKNINGFEYISSDMIQKNYDVFVMINDKDKELKIYSLMGIVEKVQKLESSMKKNVPDLYAALKKTGEESYTFTASVNGLLDIDYTTEQMAKAVGVNNAFLSADMSGYVNTIQEDFEMNMTMKLDAAPLMSENIKGMGFKKIGNDVYFQDPTSMIWTKASVDESNVQESALIMTDDSAILWLLAEDMERTTAGNQVIYKSIMTDSDVQKLVDSVTGDGVYEDVKEEFQTTGFKYSIDSIETTYVLEEDMLMNQSILIQCSLSGIQGSASLVINMEASYDDYGLQRRIETP